MEEYVQKDLSGEQPSEFHQQMLNDCKALVDMSRRKMQTYWPKWDAADMVFRNLRARDIEDVKARERAEPEKMVVPIAYSQLMTFKAFCHALFTQRERLFELEGYTAEDEMPAAVGESLLARDLRHNKFEAVLDLFLLNIARFGVGVMKCLWTTQHQRIIERKTVPGLSALGIQLMRERTIETEKEVVKYQGNHIVNVSPYMWYPDTRLPIVRFQEGEFCASEEWQTVSTLKRWEKDGVVSGVDHIKSINQRDYPADSYRHPMNEGLTATPDPTASGVRGDGQIKNMVLLTEVERLLIPSMYEVNGKPLGKEDYPIKYVVLLANRNQVLKCEPMGYIHDMFTYVAAPYIFDDNPLIPDGLSDTIGQLQDVITWFINSRITNVRKVISDKLVVKEKDINMSDLLERRPIIRLNSSAAGDIERTIKQLQLQDVTTNHISDAKFLHEIMQIATGINDSLLGQFQTGRRPATEHRNVTNGAAARQKVLAGVIYWIALEPLAQQMLSNLRDGLEEETFVKLVGMKKAVEAQQFIKVTREHLVGNYDLVVFDGTLPSERFYDAQALEELLQQLLANPQSAFYFNIDPRKVLRKILELRGIRNVESLEFDLNNPNGTGAAATGIPELGIEPVFPSPGSATRNGSPVGANGGAGGDTGVE